jgi:hypothetical protein
LATLHTALVTSHFTPILQQTYKSAVYATFMPTQFVPVESALESANERTEYKQAILSTQH